jgi:hypothetical protein
MHFPNFFYLKKNFRICFSEFKLENFRKHVSKFLYIDKNGKMGGKKNTESGKRKIQNPW